MKIDKIVLYNFNSFEGRNEFDFTCPDSEKNIILIGGKNGAGKTSLFTAIKIVLYGPLAFGYVGVNPYYIAKIKDCINSKTFQKDIVESRVQLTISLMVEREIKKYEITREWDYSRQKLEENYYVRMEGTLLDEQQLAYFQNYLQGLVPPDLFEFFLFDGEEVGNIFSTTSYNSYVRNAVYTLCRLDIFEIIRKYTGGYAGKAVDENEEKLHRQYEELCEHVHVLDEKIEKAEEQVEVNQKLLEQTEHELIEVKNTFRKAGGISEAERMRLSKEFEKAERVKTETLTHIKMFVEGLMPFFIVKDFTGKITRQLDFEEKGEIFYYVRQKLKKEEIKATLNEKVRVSDETVDELMEFMLEKFKPEGFIENTQALHDLSKEDTGRVNAMISTLDDFDTQAMVNLIYQRKAAAERTAEINKILKNAMTDEDARRFFEQENSLLKKKEELTRQVYEAQSELESLTAEAEDAVQRKNRALQNLKTNAQNKHVFELSSGLTRMMNTILTDKMVSIKIKLEQLIVEKLQCIYRKNNLITHIEIDENFQFHLYQDVKYSAKELIFLMRNLGRDSFSAEIGIQGQRKLLEIYEVDSLKQLQEALLNDGDNLEIDLYKRIDIDRLSKGERQIFILSLYWAIIELSGQDIPFVIDTPYARIDANHRREISEKFFPNISRQVIILSTDEEINEEYYSLIKPYIAKEFLLMNDESQNRTSVVKHYFFGV